MKLAGQPDPGRKITCFECLAFTPDHAADALQTPHAVTAANLFDHSQFDDAAHFEHLVHFLQRRTRNERTAIRFEVDEVVGRQLRERLTDRAALHAKYFAQLSFGQLGAGCQPMLEDRGADVLG